MTDKLTNREETKSPGNPVVLGGGGEGGGGAKHFLML